MTKLYRISAETSVDLSTDGQMISRTSAATPTDLIALQHLVAVGLAETVEPAKAPKAPSK